MYFQKSFTPIIIIIIVVVVIGVGFGAYLFTSEKSNPGTLVGLWKSNEKSTVFPNGEYLEIKENEFCFNWQVSEQEPYFTCLKYAPYIVSGNRIGFGKFVNIAGTADSGKPAKPTTIWRVDGNMLTLDEGSGGRKVYARVTSWPSQKTLPQIPSTQSVTPSQKFSVPKPSDTEKPKITSFTISSRSVKVGDQVNLVCIATDNSSVVLVDFKIVGEITVTGGSTGASSGGQYKSSGDSNTYAYTVQFAGNYTATCRASDEAKNETRSSFTFSAR